MRWLTVYVVVAAACSPRGSGGDAAPARDDAGPTTALDAAPDRPRFPPPDTRSLRLRRSVTVHAGPALESARVGTVARDTRVTWTRVQDGPGCDEAWVEIAPRGWVCARYLEPTPHAPDAVELPRVQRGAVVPGEYGKVVTAGAQVFAGAEDIAAARPARAIAGSVKVRKLGELRAGDGVYWKVGKAEYLAADAIRPIAPSTFRGARLGDDTGWELPVAFTRRGRTPRRVLELTDEAARVGEAEWIPLDKLHLATVAAPPPGVRDGERWIDVDLDQQTLIAYEGATPVYVTLISSGARKYPSETGVYRVWVKFSETDMNGQMDGEAPYSVATVPWTQFYAKDLALHTAYWHDKFGTPQSHGCINLSPIDARLLYFWSEPSVPAGWTMAHGDVEYPGSIVRVRSAADPEPELKGYAKRVYEARR